MDKEYWEKQHVEVRWNNMGTWTRDYKGTLKGFLEKKSIKVTEVDSRHYQFRIPLSSCTATLDIFDEYYRAADEAILIFLTLLGDRSTFVSGNRIYHVKW